MCINFAHIVVYFVFGFQMHKSLMQYAGHTEQINKCVFVFFCFYMLIKNVSDMQIVIELSAYIMWSCHQCFHNHFSLWYVL